MNVWLGESLIWQCEITLYYAISISLLGSVNSLNGFLYKTTPTIFNTNKRVWSCVWLPEVSYSIAILPNFLGRHSMPTFYATAIPFYANNILFSGTYLVYFADQPEFISLYESSFVENFLFGNRMETKFSLTIFLNPFCLYL